MVPVGTRRSLRYINIGETSVDIRHLPQLAHNRDAALQTIDSMEQATLRVLINQIDYTVAPPGALDNTSLPRVPVIRIYGASSTGQKACVHVHQVYPYFFVEYGGELSPNNGMSRWYQPLHISLTPTSEPVHCKIIPIFEPCYRHLDEAQSTLA
jgi:hypothetical protein